MSEFSLHRKCFNFKLPKWTPWIQQLCLLFPVQCKPYQRLNKNYPMNEKANAKEVLNYTSSVKETSAVKKIKVFTCRWSQFSIFLSLLRRLRHRYSDSRLGCLSFCLMFQDLVESIIHFPVVFSFSLVSIFPSKFSLKICMISPITILTHIQANPYTPPIHRKTIK